MLGVHEVFLKTEGSSCHTLNADEKRQLGDAAKRHGLGLAAFLRMAASCYVSKQYLTPKLEAIHRVQQDVIIARTQIERIRQEKKSFLGATKDEKIEALLRSLEQTVRASFQSPPDLKVLVKEARKHNPMLATRLRDILNEP